MLAIGRVDGMCAIYLYFDSTTLSLTHTLHSHPGLLIYTFHASQ